MKCPNCGSNDIGIDEKFNNMNFCKNCYKYWGKNE